MMMLYWGQAGPTARRKRPTDQHSRLAAVLVGAMLIMLAAVLCGRAEEMRASHRSDTTRAPAPRRGAGCDSISDQSSCDAAGCSWCKSGAVPDSCKTIDEARALPAAVFDCDHLSAGSDCDTLGDQSSCDAAGCSWCKSGAVPDSCKTIDEVRALPAAIFD
jgi:hypothetical protein